MGRFLDPGIIQELEEQTKLKLDFFRPDSPDLSRKDSDAILDLKGPGRFLVRSAGDDTVNGFSLVRDIYNRPALVLKMEMPRDIYNQGVIALRHNLIYLLIVGIVFGLVILLLMERRIISRIASLSNQVTRIKKNKDVSEKISMDGFDELSKLSIDINEMLTGIEKAQKDLKESEKFSNNILSSITNGLFVLNKEFQVVLWNPAMEKISNVSKDKVIKIESKKLWDFFPHVKDVGTDKLLQRAMAGETILNQENPFYLPDGKSGFTSESFIPLKNFDGRIKGIIGVVRDITERKRAEEVLRKSEEFGFSLLNNSPNPIAVINLDTSLRFVNPALEKLTGFSSKEIIGTKPPYPWWQDELRAKMDKDFQASVQEGADKLEEFFQKKNGEQFWVEITFTPVTCDGEFKYYLTNWVDITERKRTEESLVKAKEAAQAANRAKSRFLATISHELRTPLNGIMGLLHLIETTPLDQEQKEYVEISLNSSQGLLTIINDILSISQVEAGRIKIVEREFNLSDIVHSVIEAFKHQVAQKGVMVYCDIEESIPDILVGDGGRIRQILFNLVGNSVKFTEQGEVRVEASLLPVGDHGDNVGLLFSVSDTGMGIPDDRLEHVFEAFTQVDNSDTRRFQGTGLGLGIVKEFVGLMYGTIALESEEGVGTTVYFTVKVKRPGPLPKERRTALERRRTYAPITPSPSLPAERQPESSSERRITRGRRKTDMSFVSFMVLLVEDDPVSRISAMRMLEKIGHTVTAVRNGKEALAALEKDRFDVVFMDVQMPVMDGVEATEKIRSAKFASFDPNIPIVALTAHAMEGDKEKFLKAGMDLYIAKPMDMDELAGVLARIIPRR
ncbi:MAG: PAS domain S-box protein [Thermodesulfobacteriota bacterium]|nr:PAS domain S-box protein [Thermodesulfobacteriota bacterium]